MLEEISYLTNDEGRTVNSDVHTDYAKYDMRTEHQHHQQK